MHELIDIGANLTHESFHRDLDAVLARAASAGVGRLIVTGTSVAGSEDALRLARTRPGCLYATAGIHPHHAAEFDAGSRAALRALLTQPEVLAAGECGLDYCRNYSPHPAQRQAFEAQLELALDCGKPLFLHQREAHAEFLAMLKALGRDLPGGVAHCFTGGPGEMEDYLALGLHIGITGWICDERRADALRSAVRHLPLDRVLIESDAPYLLPRDLPHKPSARRNEPAYLPQVLSTLARHMEVDPVELGAASTANATRLFGIGAAGP